MGSVRAAPRALRLLELIGATAIAIAQPLLAVLAADTSVIVLAGLEGRDVVALAVILLLVPPIALWLVVEAGSLVDRRLGDALHVGVLGALGALTSAQLAVAAGAPGVVVALAAVVLGGALAYALRHTATHEVLRALSLLTPLLLVWFLLLSPARDLVDDPGSVVIDVDHTTTSEHPSVVLVVFDELPTLSLMAPDGSLNAELYPGFGRLAAQGTWYRNHSSAAPYTSYSIPALLSGQMPSRRPAPSWRVYPDTLYTGLAPTHALNVHEPERLCPPSIECNGATPAGAAGIDGLLGDLAEILGDRATGRGSASPTADQAWEPLAPGALARRSPEDLDAFIASLGGGPTSRFDYLHLVAPHEPWTLLPTGQRSNGPNVVRNNFFGGWTDERAALAGRIRHLRALQWVDGSVSRILDRLEALGRLDDTIVVVTADHGVSFDARAHFRASAPENLAEVYWAPLFVLRPGVGGGAIVDDPVSALDLAPTLASLVGIDLPFETDGIDVVHDARPSRPDRRPIALGDDSTLPVDGPTTTIDGAKQLRRLRELAASRPIGGPGDLHREGPHADLVGQRLEDVDGVRLEAATSAFQIEDAQRFTDLDVDADVVPLWIEAARPRGEAELVETVVTVDGIVVAAPLGRVVDDRYEIGTALPLDALHDGQVEVRVWQVVETGDVLVLEG